MNYSKHYALLIEHARQRCPLIGYVERHHVVPKCVGGSNEKENLVRLTPEEHYVAHQLLVKIYPGNKKLIFAAHAMANMSKHRNNMREYSWLKKRRATLLSEQYTGSNNPMYGKSGTMTGKKHTQEAKRKMRTPRSEQAKLNMKKPVGIANPNFGKLRSEATKQKLRGPKPTGYGEKKRGALNPNYGKKHNEETRAKMRARWALRRLVKESSNG